MNLNKIFPPNMLRKERDYIKVQKVIDSCTEREQMKAAHAFLMLYKERYGTLLLTGLNEYWRVHMRKIT